MPEDFAFAPLARKEISKVAWFPLDGNGLPKNHWGVEKFLAPLRRWIKRSRKKRRSGSNADKDQPADGRRQSTSRGGPSDSTNPAGAAEPAVDGKGRRKSQPTVNRGAATPNRCRVGEAAHVDYAAAAAHGLRSQSAPKDRSMGEPVEDVRNVATFGASGGGVGWTVEEMFAANAKLTGRDFDAYDGNPHSFGHDCDDFNGAKRSQAFVHAQQSAQQSGTSEKELVPAFAALLASAGGAGAASSALDDGRLRRIDSIEGASDDHAPHDPSSFPDGPIRRLESLEEIEARHATNPPSLPPSLSTTYPAFVDGTAHGTLEKPLPAHCITTVGPPPPPPTNELFDAVVVDASATFVAAPADASLGIAPGAAADFEFDVGDILSTLSVASAQQTS